MRLSAFVALALPISLSLLGCEVSEGEGESSDSATSAEGSTSAEASTSAESSASASDASTGTTGATTTGDGDGDGGTDTAGMCADGPLAAPIPGCAPPVPPSTGDFGQDCVDRINQFRWECQCLPPLERWYDAEVCSDTQSYDDQNGGGAHANFGACGENAQNTCPNWGSEAQVIDGCLQVMWDEGPGEPFSAHGHYITMSSMNYSKVACGRSTSNGGTWSNQNFAL